MLPVEREEPLNDEDHAVINDYLAAHLSAESRDWRLRFIPYSAVAFFAGVWLTGMVNGFMEWPDEPRHRILGATVILLLAAAIRLLLWPLQHRRYRRQGLQRLTGTTQPSLAHVRAYSLGAAAKIQYQNRHTRQVHHECWLLQEDPKRLRVYRQEPIQPLPHHFPSSAFEERSPAAKPLDPLRVVVKGHPVPMEHFTLPAGSWLAVEHLQILEGSLQNLEASLAPHIKPAPDYR